jgi:putative transposase
MADGAEGERIRAVERYGRGESISSICDSLHRSRAWFHKWWSRSQSGEPEWFRERSRRPASTPHRTAREIEDTVKRIRAKLDGDQEFCGARAIRWEMESRGLQPLPSIRTIGRILARHDLIRRRNGRYEPKGKKYPRMTAAAPGDVHQTDFVGPRYLRGGVRFYGLNSVDLATGRCATEPMHSRDAQACLDGFWNSWIRCGMPRHQQVDNEMVFYGSPRYPRAMGPLIRLCLLHEIEVWFIPLGEPWRNGVVEKFNHHWDQKFLRRVELGSRSELMPECLRFETRHNTRYRYGKLNGKTPMEALSVSGARLRFPPEPGAPRHPLPKPESGRYHLMRFVRSDGVLDVFGEKFRAPPECTYEYVQLTIDVAAQRLQVFLDRQLVDEHLYLMS